MSAIFVVAHAVSIVCALVRNDALGRSVSSARMPHFGQMKIPIFLYVERSCHRCGRNLLSARNHRLT